MKNDNLPAPRWERLAIGELERSVIDTFVQRHSNPHREAAARLLDMLAAAVFVFTILGAAALLHVIF